MNRLLIVIDSLTRKNGAHVATRAMIAALRGHGVSIDLLLGSPTDDLDGLDGVVQHVVAEPKHGLRWLVAGVYRRLKVTPAPRWTLDPLGKARRLMRQYDTVLVVGENSHFRNLVAGVRGPRKVVFIHTDYVSWKDSCGWAIEDSRFDRQIYRGFEVIAVVGQANADRFADYYPEFKEKVFAFHNLFDIKSVVDRRNHSVSAVLKIVTLSRLELTPQKRIDRIVRVAGELKRRGCQFDWTIYGRGSSEDEVKLRKLAQNENVLDVLHFAGFTSNIQEALSQADLHVLLSAYEGEPNVIVEAQMLGVPCVSTDVGAVREMIEDGKTGLIVPQDANAIADKLEKVLSQPEILVKWEKSLSTYHYDNEKVMREYKELLGIAYAHI